MSGAREPRLSSDPDPNARRNRRASARPAPSRAAVGPEQDPARLRLSNPEICQELVISEGNRKTHVARILQKLGLRDRVQAVIYAYETGPVRAGRK